MKVQSVTGALSRNELGVVSPHEHVFIDISAFYTPRTIKNFDNSDDVKVAIENLGVLNRDPYALKDNLKMTDFELQQKKLAYFKRAGGDTIVDATTNGIGRDPEKLRKISVKKVFSAGLETILRISFGYIFINYNFKLKIFQKKKKCDILIMCDLVYIVADSIYFS